VVNICQSYKQAGGYVMHFVRLATTLLKVEESARHNPPFCLSHAKYLPIFYTFFTALTDSAINLA